MKKILLGLILTGVLIGCGKEKKEQLTTATIEAMTFDQILDEAKKGGEVNSVGMPDTWANWKDTWIDIETMYGIKHTDTDMSSAEEIAKFDAEKDNATADIGDIGVGFTPMAMERGVTLPYKTKYWDEIPSWAKDSEGHWILGYTGTIAFIIDKTQVEEEKRPENWNDLLNGDYMISVGNVGSAAQANSSVLAASLALGGNEENIESGLELFGEIAKQGRLSPLDPNLLNLEKGEIQVGIMWDFNALNYAATIDRERFEVLIPKDGSLISGYATIINKYAKNPYGAMVARNHILSDKGQLNLAIGFAKPIRNISLPAHIQAKLLPNEQYEKAIPVENHTAWNETSKTLAEKWQEKVLIHSN